jgi:hypothetical protein
MEKNLPQEQKELPGALAGETACPTLFTAH